MIFTNHSTLEPLPIAPTVLTYIVNTFGWLSFAAWAVSFYPQLITNFRLKQTDGMSIDMNIFSLVGYILYTVICCIFFWDLPIRNTYQTVFHNSNLNIGLYDIVFSIHALIITILLNCQYLLYKPQNDKFSLASKWILLIMGSTLIVATLTSSVLPFMCNVALSSVWVYYLLYLSILYNIIVAIKYFPQIYYFYKHKSSYGWNICNTYFDIAGGIFLLCETATNAVRLRDYSLLYSNIAKLNLILITIICDAIIFIQYYCCYYKPKRKDSTESFESLLLESDSE